MQKRDPYFKRPEKISVWDQLTLQDTYNKKLEDEEYLRKQHENRKKMKQFYLKQIEAKNKSKRELIEEDKFYST